jgi:hypothetical protein
MSDCEAKHLGLFFVCQMTGFIPWELAIAFFSEEELRILVRDWHRKRRMGTSPVLKRKPASSSDWISFVESSLT